MHVLMLESCTVKVRFLETSKRIITKKKKKSWAPECQLLQSKASAILKDISQSLLHET